MHRGASVNGTDLIAEIGGSSSRWAWLLADGTERIHPGNVGALPGLNPLTGDASLFVSGLKEHFDRNEPEVFAARSLKVYCAGCGTEQRRSKMADTLRELWPAARIEVHTDLLAAALGLCHPGKGLVLILGTGMNAGHYDGSKLHLPMPSLGYVLGDEGSGADIGAMLLRDAFYNRMPGQIKEILFGPSGPDRAAIMEEVYRSPFPAKMLASRTVALSALLDRPYVRELIAGRFHQLAELLKTFFTADERAIVHATGSVAYGFRELLGECLADHGMDLIGVAKDPLSGLIRYERQR